jgi:hypothetical protein
VTFFQQLAYERPWSVALCATALLEEEVVEIARTGERKKTILKHLPRPTIVAPPRTRCATLS